MNADDKRYAPTWQRHISQAERNAMIRRAYHQLTRREQEWIDLNAETMKAQLGYLGDAGALELLHNIGQFLNHVADNGGDQLTMRLLLPKVKEAPDAAP